RAAATGEALSLVCVDEHKLLRDGTPPVEAAAVIVDLAKRMLEQKASGINMTR
ncbi:ethanolamine ammonia lyase small subunit, partial [Escherichia coli]|nr:ethanolamine ammonia lyase small subunit [Escherichia coli]